MAGTDVPAPERPDSKEDHERNHEGDGDRDGIGHVQVSDRNTQIHRRSTETLYAGSGT